MSWTIMGEQSHYLSLDLPLHSMTCFCHWVLTSEAFQEEASQMVYGECCLGPSRGAAWHTGFDSASKLCLCSHDTKFWTKVAYINS